MLDEERQFYAVHVDEWAKDHAGRFVVVKGENLVGIFDTLDDALAGGAERFGLSSFLVRCIGKENLAEAIPALTLGIINANP